MILPLIISLSPCVLAQDMNDEPSIEKQQSSESLSKLSKIENKKESNSIGDKNDGTSKDDKAKEETSESLEVKSPNQGDFSDSERKIDKNEENKKIIGPTLRTQEYGNLTEEQRTFAGKATISFQYADGEKVQGLNLSGVFKRGSTNDKDTVEGTQMGSWPSTVHSTVTLKKVTEGDNGIYFTEFPSVVLSRPNVVIPVDDQQAAPNDILAYGEIIRISQLEISNVPNEGYLITGSALKYRVQSIADYRYNTSEYFYQSSVYMGSSNDLSFTWDADKKIYFSALDETAKIKLPWKLYNSLGTSEAYFPVWASAIRNIPKREYPLETAPRASMVVTCGTQEGEMTVTFQNSNFIERYVDRNGTEITPPIGKNQANNVPAVAGTTYTGNFPDDYEKGILTYKYDGWHSTFYRNIAEIPGGLKSGNPSMNVVNQGGKPINGVYHLSAKLVEQYIDVTGASLDDGSFDKKIYFDNYEFNPKFNGNPDMKKVVDSDRYLYKGYLLEDEKISELKVGTPSITISQNRKIKYVYERVQPELRLKTIPTGFSFDGVLKKGKVIISSSTSKSNQISVLNTLGTKDSWNLFAELNWKGGGLGSDSRILTTSSGSIKETDLFGKISSIPSELIDTKKNLKISTVPSIIMKGTGGNKDFEGVYATDLGSISLEIDDGSKIPSNSYSGSINWNLACIP